VKKIFTLVLGVVTSIGGFVEAGSISTAVQAGAEFGFTLLWAIAVATLILASLAEMSGRIAAVGQRSIAAAVRERFGIHFQIIPLSAELVIDLLLLTAELGGTAIAVKLLTTAAVGFQWWVIPIALVVWLVLWLGNFDVIENGIGLLGIVTLSFVVAAWRLQPDLRPAASGLVPSLPDQHLARYGFLAVSIVGATVSPYLLNFYSSGAIEEKWSKSDVWINRITAFGGMGFGGVVSMGALVAAAVVFGREHIQVDSFVQASQMFVPAFGAWGTTLFALALGIGCFGAAVEITLNTGYALSQSFGWTWGVHKKRRETSRFVVAFTLVLLLATAIASLGFDPMQMTLIAVALTVVVAPLIVLPFLVLMNEARYVEDRTSGPFGNGILAVLTVLCAVMAVIVIPLQILGGG
jgi:Mn2+/Fe2+ NRAMP family transporter